MDFASTVLKSAKDLKQLKNIALEYKNEKPIFVIAGISKINQILTEICNLVLQTSEKAYLSKVELIKTKSLIIGLNLIPKNSPQQELLVQEITQLIHDLKSFLKNIHLLKQLSSDQKDYLKAYSSKISVIIVKHYFDYHKISTTTYSSEDLLTTDSQCTNKSINLSRKKTKSKLKNYNTSKKTLLISSGLSKDEKESLQKCKNTSAIIACLLNSAKLILWTPSTLINQANLKLCPDSNTNKVISFNEAQEIMNLHINGHLYIKNITTAQNCKIPTFLQNINSPNTGSTKILCEDNLSPHTIKGVYSKKNISLLTIQNNPVTSFSSSKLRLSSFINNEEIRYYYLSSSKNYTNLALNTKDSAIFNQYLKTYKNYSLEKNYCLISIIGIGLSGNYKILQTIIEKLRKAKIEVKSMQQTFPQISLNLIVKEIDHDLAIKTLYTNLFKQNAN